MERIALVKELIPAFVDLKGIRENGRKALETSLEEVIEKGWTTKEKLSESAQDMAIKLADHIEKEFVHFVDTTIFDAELEALAIIGKDHPRLLGNIVELALKVQNIADTAIEDILNDYLKGVSDEVA